MSKKIRVGIIGVGNCFAGLYQGIDYYRMNPNEKKIGLIHEFIGPYSIFDIEFTSAFDVGKNKVGKKLHEAIYEYPNMVNWIDKQKITKSDTVVMPSPILDGVGLFVENKISPIESISIEKAREIISDEIKRTKTEILVNYLPVGSQKATEFFAEIALETGCAFINCIPVFIASNKTWVKKFENKNLPVLGDDIKGMIGATIVHRSMAKLCDMRGARITKTYQINVGGNTDFLNMKEQERLESKKISKTQSVTSQLSQNIDEENIYIGPSDFIPFLGNTKLAFIRIEGLMWANIPFNLEMRLEVDDKANSAGIVIDAIRATKLALDRGIGGALVSASAFLMKSPPIQYSDEQALQCFNEFIAKKRER
ncbi:MAG: inositol-3-phosphate synthase [Candidatus Micrarchaeota archaeon]|nr:inositol-3-phosphate synthase [Candidatus Micrarchaeota archaeon]